VGVRVKLSPAKYGTWIAQMRDKKSYDLGMMGWGGGRRFEVGDTMFFQLHSESPYSWFSNADLDQTLDRARETMDPEARKQLYWKAQEIAYGVAALLPAHQTNSIYGVRRHGSTASVRGRPALRQRLHVSRRYRISGHIGPASRSGELGPRSLARLAAPRRARDRSRLRGRRVDPGPAVGRRCPEPRPVTTRRS